MIFEIQRILYVGERAPISRCKATRITKTAKRPKSPRGLSCAPRRIAPQLHISPFEVTLRTVSVPLSRFRFASTRSDSCSLTRFCRSRRRLQTRGLRRQPGRERLLRSGRNGELGGLLQRPTAYSLHTWHTCHAPEPGKYAKYGPSMSRGSWRAMLDGMHLSSAMSGMGEISESAPNEANFAESMSIVEAQDSIQVTASSGAPSRLDLPRGVAQPGEGSRPREVARPAADGRLTSCAASPPNLARTA
jgi:hypothetical protein